MSEYTHLRVALCVLILYCMVTELVDGRRGGGGGRGFRGGSYRGSYYRGSSSSYRGSSTRLSASSRGMSRTYKTAAIIGGTYYVSRSFRNRYSSSYRDNDGPTICYNIKDRITATDDILYKNRTYYGYFICPLYDDYSKYYCCGPADQETCCGYWDDGGRVTGAVIGIIIAVVVLAVIGYYLLKCFNQKPRASSGTLHSSSTTITTIAPVVYPQPPPDNGAKYDGPPDYWNATGGNGYPPPVGENGGPTPYPLYPPQPVNGGTPYPLQPPQYSYS